MTSEMAQTEDFQTRMFKKIREQLGELMTEAELKKVVDAAIQKAFFEPRQSKRDHWSSEIVTIHPLFVELIEKEVRVRVEAAAAEWVKTHQDEFTKAIDEALAKGFFGLVQQYLEQRFSQPMYTLAQELKNKGIV